jgi:peptidoglycan/xylan/chitin deacetylase (PgdA/CDA1 family)
MRRRWSVGTAAGVAVLMAFVVGCYLLANSRTFQLAGVLVNRVDTAEKVVALTFDDGPAEHTPEVLDVLARSGVPATFYLNGADLDRYPEHGAAIARAGHEIGNHTYTHRRMVLVSPGTVAEEVERTDAAIARTGYRGPVTFRPPYGKKLWTLPHYLAERDRITVTWDVEPDSGGTADTDQLVEDTVDAVQPGSIILLHVMFDGRSASRAAVPLIIERLQADGYRFVTVSDLLQQRDSTEMT